MAVGLQRAVFFYIGKRFCIRGGEEQRKLAPSAHLIQIAIRISRMVQKNDLEVWSRNGFFPVYSPVNIQEILYIQ